MTSLQMVYLQKKSGLEQRGLSALLNLMGPARIRHVHTILQSPPSPVILWIELDGKPKWRPLNFGYHDIMQTAPIY